MRRILQLHAKLYLLFRPDPDSPTVAYLGSSNLTMAGLCRQGELNVDVVDHDACAKLARWFEDRWADRWCLDISDELCRIIDETGKPVFLAIAQGNATLAGAGAAGADVAQVRAAVGAT